MTRNNDRQNETSSANYWNERSAAIDADAKAENDYAKTREGRMERLLNQISAADHGRATWDAEYEAKIDALRSELATLKAEADAEADAEWTRETTITRRAEWNTLIKSGKLNKAGKVWMPYLRTQERAQGWTMDDLKAAVARHGL